MKNRFIFVVLVFILLFSKNVFAETINKVTPVPQKKVFVPKQNYQASIISQKIIYKDEFDSFYKVGYEINIKNIGKNDWDKEGLNQVALESKYSSDNTYPIFLNNIVRSGDSITFKIILVINKPKNIYKDYLYLSKNKKELFGSGINIDINLTNIKNTLPSDKLLDIAPVEQKYSLNCESASLQMGLSYYGITKTQDEILNEVGFSTKLPAQKIGNRIIWGDPDDGFVGDYNGLYSSYCPNQTGDQSVRTLKCATGWGVNNGPITKVAKKYIKNSYELDNASIVDLKNELANGNPIIFWEVQDSKMPEENIDIYTKDTWKKINYTRTHVVLLIGYTNIGDETIYTFNDPATGNRINLAEPDMRRIWDRYNDNITVLKK